MEEKKLGQEGFINPALPSLTKLYANGFAAGYNAADMYVIGLTNGVPNFVLNLSFTSAKSLHSTLDQLIKTFEKKADFEIHSADEISAKLQK